MAKARATWKRLGFIVGRNGVADMCVASNLVRRFKTIKRIFNASTRDLLSVEGVEPHVAYRIRAIKAFANSGSLSSPKARKAKPPTPE